MPKTEDKIREKIQKLEKDKDELFEWIKKTDQSHPDWQIKKKSYFEKRDEIDQLYLQLQQL